MAAKRAEEDAEYASAKTPVAGIPLLVFDGAREDRTQLNSKYTVTGAERYSLKSKGFNRYLEISVGPNETVELDAEVPKELWNTANFKVYGYGLKYEVLQVGAESGTQIEIAVKNENGFPLTVFNKIEPISSTGEGSVSHIVPTTVGGATATDCARIVITIENQSTEPLVLRLDDIVLYDDRSTPATFVPGSSETELLDWLAESSYRFFDWNFVLNSGNTSGVFLEEQSGLNRSASRDLEKVSLSGQGMSIAVTILAAEAGFIDASTAEDRISKVIQWLENLNNDTDGNGIGDLNDGKKGWHGMPSHYYHANGDLYLSQMALSTIDWAMCAQGLRLAQQYYSSNITIDTKVENLLTQVDWEAFVMPVKEGTVDPQDPADLHFRNGGRIAFDLNQQTGDLNLDGNAWGQAFSEETDLVYLEALAANMDSELAELPFIEIDINKVIYTDESGRPIKVINRKWKDGFFPSFFGAGFTYNWMQLWAGSKELEYDGNDVYQGISSTVNTKFYDNSVMAYTADYNAVKTQFLQPFMGLTAASTVSSINKEGFVDYGQYISNQGSFKHIAKPEEVVQVAPAAYGAALALPFIKVEALEALQAYVDLGFYHEYMGMPDNVVFRGIGGLEPLPNWNHLDINIAPLAMSINQTRNNIISTTLMSSEHFREAYEIIYSSFNADYSTQSGNSSNRIAEESTIELLEQESHEIVIYPNPTTGDFTVRIHAKELGTYHGVFMDASGKIIHKVKWDLSESGYYELPVNGLGESKIGNGIYFMAIFSESGQVVLPVIIKD